MNQDEALKILKELEQIARKRNHVTFATLAENPPNTDQTSNKERLLLTSTGLKEQSGIYNNTDEESYWRESRSVNPSRRLVRKYQIAKQFLDRLAS